MAAEAIFSQSFVAAVKKPYGERSEQDIEVLCHVLRRLSEFTTSDNHSLRSTVENLSYKNCSKQDILYRPGDLADCWYYIMSGSVMISNTYTYSEGCSFGQSKDSVVRTDYCYVLEDSELVRIQYTEKEMERFERRSKRPSIETSPLPQGAAASKDSQPLRIANSLPSPSFFPGQLGVGGTDFSPVTTVGMTSELVSVGAESESQRGAATPSKILVGHTEWSATEEESEIFVVKEGSGHGKMEREKRDYKTKSADSENCFRFDADTIKNFSASSDSLNRAVEQDPIRLIDHLAPTPSSPVDVKMREKERAVRRRSAPPAHHRSLRDSVGSLEYLSESHVDMESDDEESIQSENSNTTGMDYVYEVLSKPSADRSDEDIDRVMDVLQYMPAFSNMTANTRRSLFQVLMLNHYDNENSVVVDNGDRVDKWYVVLNGQLRLLRDSEPEKVYHIGEAFGVSTSLKVLPQRGKLVTATKDCQLCYVNVMDYGQVLAHGEENMHRVYEEGELVAVLEKRAVPPRREGYFVIQAKPQKLLEYLIQETIDDSFHRDFLLTYRTFLSTPDLIVEAIRSAWLSGAPERRERLTMIVLDWVTEHFSDFECNEEMNQFLDWFEDKLVEDGKIGPKRALDQVRISNANIRSIELDRDGVAAPLDFSVVGGWEVGHAIFVSEVTPESRPAQAGLSVGDQILTVNDTKCDKRELREVLNILQKNYRLSLSVRSNIPEFRQFISDPPNPPSEIPLATASHSHHSHPIIRSLSTSASSRPVIHKRAAAQKGSTTNPSSASPKNKKKTPGFLKPLVKTFTRNNIESIRNKLKSSSHSASNSPSSGPLKASKKLSTRKSEENLLDESSTNGNVLRSTTSAEDIHALAGGRPKSSSSNTRSQIVDAVVKLHAPDHTTKYIDISPNDNIADLIERGVKEVYPERFVASPAEEFCICMVTVTSRNGPIRNSVLPSHLTDLANFIGLESRYYLKERAFHGTLVQDDEAETIVKESKEWENLLNLKPMQIAEELTRQDSGVFCSIELSEYIADLWKNPNPHSKQHLERFENIPNEEMYWVITTVVTETNVPRRAKLIKHFIKIAKCCRSLKNYNTMFHILSGLNHGLVQRLKTSWEKVSHRHRRLMEELVLLMNPFHNMAKYRELQRATKPPLIPFFPIVKKDLTFLYDGNDTIVEGLINFEKLRMLSQQIRVVKKFCERQIVPASPEVDLSQYGVFKSTISSLHGSLRWRHKSHAQMMSITETALKKVYLKSRMSKMVQKHLDRKYVLQDESCLEQIVESQEKLMMPLRRNPPSPVNKGKRNSAAASLSVRDKHKSANLSPSPTVNSIGSESSSTLAGDSSTPPLVHSSLANTSLSASADTPTRSPSVNSMNSSVSGVGFAAK